MMHDLARPGRFDQVDRRAVSRRQLIRAGVWAAPVLVLTTAAPAAAASVVPPGAVPVSQLTVQSNGLSDVRTGGTPGPLAWAGGRFTWASPGPGAPTLAPVSYTVVLTGPGGLNVSLVPAGVANVAPSGFHDLPAVTWGTKPMAAGVYTVTVTIISGTESKSAQSSVTVAASPPPPVAASLNVAPDNKKRVFTLTLTGTPFTVVTIGVSSSSNVHWNPAIPSTATIGSNGTMQVGGTAHATANTAGTASITLSAPAGVNPAGFPNILIPA